MKYIVNPVTGQYESTAVEPSREEKRFKFDSVTGKFRNNLGQVAKDGVAAVAENNKIFPEDVIAKQKEDKLMKYIDDVKKGDYLKYEQAAADNARPKFSDIDLKNLGSKKKKPKPYSDIDSVFQVASPREKMDMRKRHKDYNFDKRMAKADLPPIPKTIPLTSSINEYIKFKRDIAELKELEDRNSNNIINTPTARAENSGLTVDFTKGKLREKEIEDI